jgi:hypothetical protein
MPEKSKEVNNNRTLKKGKPSGWEFVIERAESHLRSNKLQAARLRAAIRVFQEKLAKGEPWPGGKSAA